MSSTLREKELYTKYNAPNDLIQLVNDRKLIPREPDVISIPVHQLTKDFEPVAILRAIEAGIKYKKKQVDKRFQYTNKADYKRMENFAFGLSKFLDKRLSTIYKYNKREILVRESLGNIALFYTRGTYNLVFSPFDEETQRCPNFEKIKATFVEILNDIVYKIGTSTFRIKAEENALPYFLFYFKTPPTKGNLTERLFKDYLHEQDEVIASSISKEVDIVDSNDNHISSYFVVKLVSEVAPPKTKPGNSFAGTSVKALTNLPRRYIQQHNTDLEKYWMCENGGHLHNMEHID